MKVTLRKSLNIHTKAHNQIRRSASWSPHIKCSIGGFSMVTWSHLSLAELDASHPTTYFYYLKSHELPTLTSFHPSKVTAYHDQPLKRLNVFSVSKKKIEVRSFYTTYSLYLLKGDLHF